MGLTNWQGPHVRKGDVTTAKNYLNEKEIEALNRIVTMYLDYAEDQAKNRKTTTMHEWENKLDAFLSFNGRDILTHAGKISHEIAEKLAHNHYEEFNSKRRTAQRLEEDKKDIRLLEELRSTKKKS